MFQKVPENLYQMEKVFLEISSKYRNCLFNILTKTEKSFLRFQFPKHDGNHFSFQWATKKQSKKVWWISNTNPILCVCACVHVCVFVYVCMCACEWVCVSVCVQRWAVWRGNNLFSSGLQPCLASYAWSQPYLLISLGQWDEVASSWKKRSNFSL